MRCDGTLWAVKNTLLDAFVSLEQVSTHFWRGVHIQNLIHPGVRVPVGKDPEAQPRRVRPGEAEVRDARHALGEDDLPGL